MFFSLDQHDLSRTIPHPLQFLGGFLGPLGSRNRNPGALLEMRGNPSEMSQDEIVPPRDSWGTEIPGGNQMLR